MAERHPGDDDMAWLLRRIVGLLRAAVFAAVAVGVAYGGLMVVVMIGLAFFGGDRHLDDDDWTAVDRQVADQGPRHQDTGSLTLLSPTPDSLVSDPVIVSWQPHDDDVDTVRYLVDGREVARSPGFVGPSFAVHFGEQPLRPVVLAVEQVSRDGTVIGRAEVSVFVE